MADFNTPVGRQLHKRPDEEVWESCVKGRVWVEITDARGMPKVTSTLGVGARLRITAEDRQRNQERIVDIQGDPFINGMLRRIDANQSEDPTTDSPQALADEDLKMVFTLEQAAFEEYVSELNELNVRRMKDMAPVNASVLQDKFLDEQLQTRWPIGGDTPTYREMTGVKD